jgi:broad specificity phosphatase PhoE
MPKKLPFLPDEHHYGIAHVATRAAQLDYAIESCVSAQMRSHRETAEHLIKRLDANRLVDLLDALLRDNFPTRLSEIEKLITDIKAARAERNEVLHWIWGKDDDPAIAKMASLRLYREEQIKTKTAEELYALADRLLAAASALLRFDPWLLETYSDEAGSART